MELLQTIWTALTTPNEGLLKILAIPFTFLDIYVSMILFTNILNIEASSKNKIIYTIIFGILSNFISLPIFSLLTKILLSLSIKDALS